MGRSVLVMVNREKPDADRALAEVRRLVERHGRLAGVMSSDQSEVPASDCEVDLVAVLGGDGSLLSAAHRTRAFAKPILGINIGRVGFMAGFDLERLEKSAAGLFGSGSLATRKLWMIGVEVFSREASEARFRTVAFNEFVVTAGPPFRMISLALSIDGESGPAVSGDGLIVSTAMGSTAYNVSAGGPIVSPGVNAYVITPIAAHSLSFRPIVVPSTCVIELIMGTINHENGGGTTLVADGQISHRVREGDRIRFSGTDEFIELVIDPGVSYWQTLLQKMHWAAAPRQRERS